MQYDFTTLSDVKFGEFSNVMGIIKYCSDPKKTKGKDYQMTVSITDSSIGYDGKMVCNLFNAKPENLPRVTGRGDVIIMHKLKISKFRNKFQGIGIQKEGFNVAVFPKTYIIDTENESYERIISNMSSIKNQFSITMENLKLVQQLQEWGDSMPSSEVDDGEINLDAIQFALLSEISPRVTCSLTAQVISVISINHLEYQTLVLIWDGTIPGCDLNETFMTFLSDNTKEKHHTELMAQLGGKITNPYIAYIFLKEESLIDPGDFVYFHRVFVEPPLNGPGVCLVAERCRIGVLTKGSQQYDKLHARLTNFTDCLPCVADCISTDLSKLSKWSLKEYGKMMKQLDCETDWTDDKVCQFNITARVVKVHPSTEKEFHDSILFFCTCCQELKNVENVSQITNNCRKNLVPIPMITLIFEDFTGWLSGIIVGRSVLDMFNLVMIDAKQPDWWCLLFSQNNHELISQWISHVNRLAVGYIEGKLIFKRASLGKVLPFVEDIVLLDYL